MDCGEQLQIQQQINELIKQREAMLKRQNALMSQQSKLAASMSTTMQNAAPQSAVDRIQQMRDGLEEAVEDAENLADNLEDAADNAEKSGGGIKSMLGGLGGFVKAGAGLLGISSIFNKIGGAVQGIAGFLGSAIRGVFGLTAAILTLPLKMFFGLVEMAGAGGGGGPNPIKQALEEIRTEIGSIASNEGLALAKTAKAARKQMNNLAGTGLKMRRIFGRGRAGVAEILKQNAELAKAMGASLTKLIGVFEKAPVALNMYRKGLGLTAEAQAAVLKHGKAMGKDPVDAQREMASMAVKMGERFDISSKIIGKAMGEMVSDVQNFGHMATKEIGAATTYAIKLGIEVKELAGVIDKFMNFDDAADAVSQLSQAFGVQLDVQRMVLEENPAKKIDQLRQAFFRAGKDIATMTAAERKLLSQTTGLSGASLEAAFSASNQATSYDDMAKASEKAAKAQLSQAEVMKKLAKNVERLVKGGGGGGYKGFFDAFAKGFKRGFRRAEDFRKIIRFLRKDLKNTYRMGKEVGKMFMEFFPGVKQIFKGLQKIFEPTRFKSQLLDPIKNAFRDFFLALSGPDPKFSVEVFLAKIKDIFIKWVSGGKEGGGDILEGFKNFGTAIKNIFIGLLPVIGKGIIWMLNQLSDFINDPSAAGPVFDAIYDTFAGVFEEIAAALQPLAEPFVQAWDRLVKSLLDRFGPIIDEYQGKFEEWGTKILGAIFSNSVVQVVMGVLLGMLALKVIGVMVSIAALIKGSVAAGGAAAAGGIAAFSEMMVALAGIPAMAILKGAGILVLIGGFMYAVTEFVIIPIIEALNKADNVSGADLVGIGIFMATLIGTVGAIVYQLAMIDGLTRPILGNALFGAAIIGLIAGAMAGIMGLSLWGVLAMFEGSKLDALGPVMAAMASFIAVAGVVTLKAAAIGTTMALSLGTGVAAVLAGLAVIGTVVAGMAKFTADAVKTLSKGIPSSGLDTIKKKVDMMVDVTNAITPLVNLNEAFAKIEDINAQALERLIDKNKASVIGIMKEAKELVLGIVKSAKGLKLEDIKKAGAVGKLLGAIGQMINSFKQPYTDIVNATERSLGILQGAGTLAKRAGQLMDKATSGMDRLIKTTSKTVDDLIKTISERKQVVKSEAEAELFEREGSVIVKMIAAAANFTQAFAQVLDVMDFNAYVPSSQVKKKAKDLEIYGTAIGDVLGSVGTALSGAMATMVGMISGLAGKYQIKASDPKFIGGVELIIKMIGSFGKMVRVLSSLFKMLVGEGDEKGNLRQMLGAELFKDNTFIMQNWVAIQDSRGVFKKADTSRVNSTAAQYKSATQKVAIELATSLFNVVKILGFAAGQMITQFAGIANSEPIKKLVSQKDFGKRMEIVLQAMSAAASAVKVVASLAKMFEDPSKPVAGNPPLDPGSGGAADVGPPTKPIKQSPMMRMIEFLGKPENVNALKKLGEKIPPLVDAMLTGLIPVISRMGGKKMNIKAMKGKIEVLKGMMELASTVITTTTQFGKDGLNESTAGNMTQVASYAFRTLMGVINPKAAVKAGAIAKSGASLTGLSQASTFMQRYGKGIKAPPSNIVAAMDGHVLLLQSYLRMIPVIANVGDLHKQYGVTLLKPVEDMVTMLNDINSAIDGLFMDGIDIHTAVDNFTNAIATGGSNRTIEIMEGNFQMTVNVTVNLDRTNTIAYLSGEPAKPSARLAHKTVPTA